MTVDSLPYFNYCRVQIHRRTLNEPDRDTSYPDSILPVFELLFVSHDREHLWGDQLIVDLYALLVDTWAQELTELHHACLVATCYW